jgi:hypothetical protein
MSEHPIARRPHNVAPALSSTRLILVIRNWAQKGTYDMGLGVIIGMTMTMLRRRGVQAERWYVRDAEQIFQKLEADEWRRGASRPITHVVINTPGFIQPSSFARLADTYPDIEFVQLNHSGLSYLSIDVNGIANIRDALSLQQSRHNVRVGAVNPRFTHWLHAAFSAPQLLLPNLYDTWTYVGPVLQRPVYDPLRIGGFGAGRPWKNQLCAAEAAVALARGMNVSLELYVNSGRDDADRRMVEARQALFKGLPQARLVEVPWGAWPEFTRTVRAMDLLICASFDETFCVVCADGIAQAVPSVVGPAIEWAPLSWRAPPEDPVVIARVALGLLHGKIEAVHDGRRALDRYVAEGTRLWIDYLAEASR